MRRTPVALMAVSLIWLGVGCKDIGDDPPTKTQDSGGDALKPSPVDGGELPDQEDANSELAIEASDGETELNAEDDDAATANSVLANQGLSCADCAQASCKTLVQGCDTIVGDAVAGPAAGTPRARLCPETLACVLSTDCAKTDDSRCICGPPTITGDPTDCYVFPVTATGPCRNELQRSMETFNPLSVVSSFSDPSRAGGWALLLFHCLADNHCQGCFASPNDGGADADGS